MEFTFPEIVKLAAVGVGLLVLALSFVHLTKQKRVSRSITTSLMISIRFAIVYIGLFWIWCVLLRMPVDFFLILIAVWLVFSTLTLASPESGEMFLFAIGIVLGGPLLFLLSFIYWDSVVFDSLVLHPSEPTSEPKDKSTDSQEHLHAIGTVVATLKPTGAIEINGSNHSAATEDGKFLDVGATVEVRSYRNRTMLVRVVEEIET